MTIQKPSNFLIFGLSSDTKPTTHPANTILFEQDTGRIYRYSGSAWALFQDQYGYDYSYIIYKSGSTYYAQTGNGPAPAITSNSNFSTLFNSVISGISPAGTPTRIVLAPGDYDIPGTGISIPSTAIGNISIECAGMGLTNLIMTSAWNGNPIGNGVVAIKIGTIPTIASGNTGTPTANIALRALTCTMSTTDSAKFAVGDYIMITSSAAWSTDPSATSPQTEIKRVNAVNTGTGVLTFDVPTFDAYTTANTTKVYKLNTFMSNIRVANLTIKKGSGVTTDTTNTNGFCYFATYFIDNLQLENIQLIEPVTRYDNGISVHSCINSNIEGLNMIMPEAATYNLQYGLAIEDSSQNITISNCQSIGHFRHPFELGNDETGNGGALNGIIRGLAVNNCTAEGSIVAAFDTHPGTESMSLTNCKVMGTTITTGAVGFEIRSRRTNMSNCSVYGANTYGFQLSGDAHDCIINCCISRGCLSDGIRLINDVSGVKRTKIIGCSVLDNGNNGIRIDSGCDYTQIIGNSVNNNSNNGMYLADSDYLIVTNNVVNSNTNSGIWVDPATLTLSNNQIINNVLTGNGSPQIKTSTSATGTFATSNILRDNVGFSTADANTITLTNKSIALANNTVTDTSAALGDIAYYNGTRFVRFARGSTNQVLQSTATTIQWATFNAENTGIAVASGNGSTTVFNIAHSIGSTPSIYTATCLSHTNTFTVTVTSTNIVVTFSTAPSSGTNNVKIYWRAVA